MFTDSLFLSPILLVSRKRIIVSITLAFARIPIFQVANISLFTQASFFVLSMPCVQSVGHLTMHLTQMIVQFAGDVLAPSLCSFLLWRCRCNTLLFGQCPRPILPPYLMLHQMVSIQHVTREQIPTSGLHGFISCWSKQVSTKCNHHLC